MTVLSLEYLRVGQCRHLECIAARGGQWKMIDFPSMCGLIKHSTHGWILFDTGYSEHFHHASQKLPERLYRTMLPVSLPEEEKLTQQLKARGIQPEDISMVVVSHYHGDHVAGLRDFPNARFIASQNDTEEIAKLQSKPWTATLQGKLPKLLPEDFFSRLDYVERFSRISLPDWMHPFDLGCDLLGDGSLLAIALPGHSKGQIGLLAPDANGRPVFMVADACWSLLACKQARLPSVLARLAIANNAQYSSTFNAVGLLASRESALSVLPSHCTDSWKAYRDDV